MFPFGESIHPSSVVNQLTEFGAKPAKDARPRQVDSVRGDSQLRGDIRRASALDRYLPERVPGLRFKLAANDFQRLAEQKTLVVGIVGIEWRFRVEVIGRNQAEANVRGSAADAILAQFHATGRESCFG